MGLALEAGLSLADFWASTPRTVMVAWQAYQRRRAFSAWFAGAPANFPKLTFAELAGESLPERPAMSAEQMMANLRRFAVAHNAALAARANDNRKADDGQ